MNIAKHELYVTLGVGFMNDIKLFIECMSITLVLTLGKFRHLSGTANRFHPNDGPHGSEFVV